jgi:sugar/nucleoside kinase (ribokinase family)
MSVLVIGGTGIDTIVPVPSLTLPAADSVQAGPIREYVAHTGTGVAFALRALGRPVTVVDAIGEDEAGQRVRHAMAAAGVPLHAAVAPAGTRRAVNLMDPHGRRLSLYDARDTPGYRMPAGTYRALLPAALHAHVSIMDWARHLLPDLRAAGLSISTDLHDWDGQNPHHRDFAYAADLVFLSTANLAGRVTDAAGDILRRGAASHVLATSGAAGATLFSRDAPDRPVHQPAVDPGAPVVNTNGAGDAFAAGFLAGWLDGRPASDCLRRAAVAGAFACTRDVGESGFITAEQLATAAATP